MMSPDWVDIVVTHHLPNKQKWYFLIFYLFSLSPSYMHIHNAIVGEHSSAIWENAYSIVPLQCQAEPSCWQYNWLQQFTTLLSTRVWMKGLRKWKYEVDNIRNHSMIIENDRYLWYVFRVGWCWCINQKTWFLNGGQFPITLGLPSSAFYFVFCVCTP